MRAITPLAPPLQTQNSGLKTQGRDGKKKKEFCTFQIVHNFTSHPPQYKALTIKSAIAKNCAPAQFFAKALSPLRGTHN